MLKRRLLAVVMVLVCGYVGQGIDLSFSLGRAAVSGPYRLEARLVGDLGLGWAEGGEAGDAEEQRVVLVRDEVEFYVTVLHLEQV